MKNMMTPHITLAIVLVTAMAAVALHAAARRPEPRRAPGAGSVPTAVRPPDFRGPPASATGQMQDIFHELHADGRHAVCTVCDSRYRLA